MKEQTVLETSRLKIRHLVSRDAAFIQEAASERSISDTMISILYPFPQGEGDRYIARHLKEQKTGKSETFILELKKGTLPCGVVEIREIDREHSQAELSFWLAEAYRGYGYMSEAIKAALQHGFEILKLNRFYAHHMLRNPASGRVLEKNGFRMEGILRQRVRKWGKFEDVALWAILKQDWIGQII
jgi:ribosomal-protein-alanine N-acetyltransferase